MIVCAVAADDNLRQLVWFMVDVGYYETYTKIKSLFSSFHFWIRRACTFFVIDGYEKVLCKSEYKRFSFIVLKKRRIQETDLNLLK